MDPKKNPNYMQKAIQKASRLIDLLTNENNELKSQNIHLQQQLNASLSEVNKISLVNQEFQQKVKSLQIMLEQKTDRLSTIQKQFKLAQQKLKQKTNKNKQLYEKLGEYVTKNQQISKNLQKQKKRNLSLSNQNQYLLKSYAKNQEKENKFQNYCLGVQQEFRKQIGMVDRTRQAYARKCQQLKMQNFSLRQQLVILTTKINEFCQKQSVNQASSLHLSQVQTQLKRANDALNIIIESILRVKPQSGLYLKIQQIKNYLSYRIQHIENLIKPITQSFNLHGNKVVTGQIKDLQNLATTITRLSSYLNQLVK